MTIHFIDKNGKRAQLPDRAALVDALRRDEISGETQVYVPSRNDFVPLREVFDIKRLREGDTVRRPAAPAKADAPALKPSSMLATPGGPAKPGKPAASARKKTSVAAVIVGVLLVGSIGKVVVEDRLEERRAHAEQARRQMADDLTQVKAQIQEGMAEKSASAGAALKSPVAQLISEHLAEIQSLSSTHKLDIEKIAGDDLMTPASLSTRAGIDANRLKLAAMKRAIDGYFASVKKAKADYLRKADQLGAQATASRDEKMRRVNDFLERAQQANQRVVSSMGKMNDFAAELRPALKNDALIFNRQADLSRWREMSDTLTRDHAALQKLESEGQQIEKGSVDELQQQIGKLRQPTP